MSAQFYNILQSSWLWWHYVFITRGINDENIIFFQHNTMMQKFIFFNLTISYKLCNTCICFSGFFFFFFSDHHHGAGISWVLPQWVAFFHVHGQWDPQAQCKGSYKSPDVWYSATSHTWRLTWSCIWYGFYSKTVLTHWGRDKMADISQTTFSNAFSWMKIHQFRLILHWSLFLRVELTIFQHRFR